MMKTRIFDLLNHHYGKKPVKMDRNEDVSEMGRDNGVLINDRKRSRRKPGLIVAGLVCVAAVVSTLLLPIWRHPVEGISAHREGDAPMDGCLDDAYGNQRSDESNGSVSEECILISSESYALDLIVPRTYTQAVIVDTPYVFEYEFIDEIVTLESTVFSFSDVEQETMSNGKRSGYLWSICVYPIDEYDWAFLDRFENATYLLNKIVLATDLENVYELNYPYAAEMYDVSNYESYCSYQQKAWDGIEILQDFVVQNGLAINQEGFEKYAEYLENPIDFFYQAPNID